MNILITGIGGPTPKGIARSLKLENPEIRIIGIDANPYAPGFYAEGPYDRTYLVPNASLYPEEYWDKIEEISASEKIDFAFVVPETEVLQWSRKKMEGGIPCDSFLPDSDVADFLFDKKKVSDLLYPYGLSPRTLSTGKEELESIGDELGYPYWIRVNKTAGAIGSLKINTISDVKNWLNINDSEVPADYISSSYLPGRNYACKLLYKDNNLELAAVGERIEYLLANASPSGISGMCSRGRLLNREDIIQASEKALKIIFDQFQLPINGMFTVDFKDDQEGHPLITEINIRHVSFTAAFSLGGANFAQKTLDMIAGKAAEPKGYFNFREEFNFIRGVDNELVLVREEAIKSQNPQKSLTGLKEPS